MINNNPSTYEKTTVGNILPLEKAKIDETGKFLLNVLKITLFINWNKYKR